jgi:hypothetical protein
MFKKCIGALTLIALLTGCATPPAFITATPVTAEQKDRLRQVDCNQLMTDLAFEESREKTMSSEMAGRAAKQLLLNAIAVGTLATIGFGMTYTAHGEGDRRDALRRSRSEIEAMRAVATEKRCPPVAVPVAPIEATSTTAATATTATPSSADAPAAANPLVPSKTE